MGKAAEEEKADGGVAFGYRTGGRAPEGSADDEKRREGGSLNCLPLPAIFVCGKTSQVDVPVMGGGV